VREDDGRKLDHQTLEALRLRAVEQVARGVPAAEVGAGLAALGLHRRTIYTWLATARAEGRQALRAKPVPGRPRKVCDEQLSELAGLIAESDPRDHGFAVALWTREVIRQLIEARFAVQLTVASVGRTLHELGFPPSVRSTGPSRPTPSRWPGGKRSSIRRSPRPPGPPAGRCTSSTRPGCAATTTPAPPGPRSPRPRRCAPPAPGSPLFMISAISAQGALRFSVLTGTLTAAGFIAFLQRLLHDAEHT